MSPANPGSAPQAGLDHVRRTWDRLGEQDPLWAVLSHPDKQGGRWEVEEFFRTGELAIDDALATVEGLGLRPERQRALDFGCGVGRLTQALARHFDAVTGVDVAASMIQEAERFNRFPDRVSYHLNARADLSLLPAGGFDFVFSTITLQHMQPRLSRRYLAEFVRVLAPAGVAMFDVPVPTRVQAIKAAAPAPLLSAYQRLVSRRRPRMEMYGLRPADVDRVVHHAGGAVRHCEPSYAGVQDGRTYLVTRRS